MLLWIKNMPQQFRGRNEYEEAIYLGLVFGFICELQNKKKWYTDPGDITKPLSDTLKKILWRMEVSDQTDRKNTHGTNQIEIWKEVWRSGRKGHLCLITKFCTEQRRGAEENVVRQSPASEAVLTERVRKASTSEGESATESMWSSSVTLSSFYRKPWYPELWNFWWKFNATAF